MCNLYSVKTSRGEVAAHFRVPQSTAAAIERGELEKDYVSPGREGWVVRKDGGERALDLMRRGFPPPAGVKAPVVNVRNYASPFWRSALTNPERRCLVPATRFQEWSAAPDPATGKKRPFWFNLPFYRSRASSTSPTHAYG